MWIAMTEINEHKNKWFKFQCVVENLIHKMKSEGNRKVYVSKLDSCLKMLQR